MIIWINGVRGVGKTSLVNKLYEKLKNEDIKILNSDLYFSKMFEENEYLVFKKSGTHPYDNIFFCNYFQNIIENELKTFKYVIVDMSLLGDNSKTLLHDYLSNIYPSLHFIINCSKEHLIDRILQDNKRAEKEEQIQNLEKDLFFLKKYEDAIIIDTDEKSINEIVMILFQYIMEEK